MKVNIILFDDFETLDVFGPVEVLGAIKSHELHYYSMNGKVVTSAQGTQIITEDLDDMQPGGIVVIPGGRGTRKWIFDTKFLDSITTCAEKAAYCLTICTGSALLAKTHMLDGKKATSNKRAFEWVSSVSEQVKWVKEARWVVDGTIYTSSGVSAGIDMALGFIRDQYGEEEAEDIADGIEYLWNQDENKDPFCR